MTECSPLIAACPINVVKHSNSLGSPVPNTDIKIIKDDGSDAKIGEAGEFMGERRSRNARLLATTRATSEVLKDGWMATGDIVSYG